tara:strand:+ start:49136 stop:49870 length:735 start_codon:yes stop_codon:yes gene_type:complete
MERYGLLGKRLDYSFSKSFFTEKFDQDSISATYENIELSDVEKLKLFFSKEVYNYQGLNVTIPYKQDVIPYLTRLSDDAKAIGAVNTIKVEGKELIGHNTDAYGFGKSIKPFFRNVHEKALILGTGGASKAVEYVLENLGVEVFYLSRSPEGANQFSYDEANELMINTFKLIVNCTPLGTHPNVDEMPNIPIQFVGKDHLVVDLIYNPEETKLLRLARENDADTMNGLSMLQHQALKAWDIWQS